MRPLSMVKERITLSLLAADIPIQACLSNWFGSGGGNPSFAPLVDFQWPGFLGIPIQYRVVLVGDCPREFKPDDMYGMESQWPDFHLIFIASERPAKVKVEYACQWFTIEEFIQAVERIPKNGNPFSLNLELQNAYRTNAEQQVMINRLALEVEKLRLRVPGGEYGE